VIGKWGDLSSWRRDWSSPAFLGEGILVVATVVAVGRGGGAAARASLGVSSLGVSSLGASGILASVG